MLKPLHLESIKKLCLTSLVSIKYLMVLSSMLALFILSFLYHTEGSQLIGHYSNLKIFLSRGLLFFSELLFCIQEGYPFLQIVWIMEKLMT